MQPRDFSVRPSLRSKEFLTSKTNVLLSLRMIIRFHKFMNKLGRFPRNSRPKISQMNTKL